MSSLQKSLISAAAVMVAAAALVAGTVARDQADLHMRSLSPFASSSHSLLASLSNAAPDASASDFYELVTKLLEDHYVDPITDEPKLAIGGVRGMVTSLDNPDCVFMDAKEFKAFNQAAMGRFEGIGAELAFQVPSAAMLDSDTPGGELVGGELVPVPVRTGQQASADAAVMPALVVAAVVPGSPADKAGVKAGDSVEELNGHWVMNPYDLDRFTKIQKLQKAGKVTIAQYLEVRRDLRKKLGASVAPNKVKDALSLGTAGSVKVVWNRHGQLIPTTITRAVSNEAAVQKMPDGSIAVHFLQGAAGHLKELATGDSVTLDLRNNQYGDLAEMKDCLALFAPAGSYGVFENFKGQTPKTLTIKEGNKPRKLTLIVDNSTGGPAEMFALALKAKGYATLQGPPMASDRNLLETVKLSDGSGYTLVTGVYRTEGRKKSAVTASSGDGSGLVSVGEAR